jgi:hypothetical protein
MGSTNKTIARTLGISEGTVKIHLASIFAQLGAPNRAAAVAIYNGWQNGYLEVLRRGADARRLDLPWATRARCRCGPRRCLPMRPAPMPTNCLGRWPPNPWSPSASELNGSRSRSRAPKEQATRHAARRKARCALEKLTGHSRCTRFEVKRVR